MKKYLIIIIKNFSHFEGLVFPLGWTSIRNSLLVFFEKFACQTKSAVIPRYEKYFVLLLISHHHEVWGIFYFILIQQSFSSMGDLLFYSLISSHSQMCTESFFFFFFEKDQKSFYDEVFLFFCFCFCFLGFGLEGTLGSCSLHYSLRCDLGMRTSKYPSSYYIHTFKLGLVSCIERKVINT